MNLPTSVQVDRLGDIALVAIAYSVAALILAAAYRLVAG